MTAKAANNLVFNAGIPTEPDVRKLMEYYDDLKEGQQILKEEIANITGLDVDSFRFKTVVTAWRKRLDRENNIVLVAVQGVGYKVADPDLRINVSGAKYKSGLRHVRRAGSIAARTDTARLSKEATRAAHHITNVAAAVMLAAATQAKQLRYEAPVKQIKK